MSWLDDYNDASIQKLIIAPDTTSTDYGSLWDSNSEDESDSSWTAPAGNVLSTPMLGEVDFNDDGYVTDWNHPSNQSQTSSSSNNTPAPASTPAAPPPTPQESIQAELTSWGGTEEQVQAIGFLWGYLRCRSGNTAQ